MKKLLIFVLSILSVDAYATQPLKESVYPPVTNFPFEIKVNPLSDINYKISITNKKINKPKPLRVCQILRLPQII